MTQSELTDKELEELEGAFAAFVDGELDGAEAAALQARIEAEPAVRAAFEEFQQTLSALGGLHKIGAPPAFGDGVTETIHRRSSGLFFGRRAFGDRVPFELLALVALAIILVVALLVRRSSTGSIGAPQTPDVEAPAPEVREVIPKP